MGALQIQSGDGQKIQSVEDWLKYAPPKMKEKHWCDFRSAKELAKAWFRTGIHGVPEEIEALFNSHSFTGGAVIDTVIPEKQIKLDNFKGETRNSDLIIIGSVGEKRIVAGLEAKADESFGPVIGEYLKEKHGTRSKVPDRINSLLRSIFGQSVDVDLGKLRYQLLHGLAGTLIEAKNQGASLAIFIVHEFISKDLNQEKIDQNRGDFERFVHSFKELEKAEIGYGVLHGPIKVPGGEFVPKDIPVLIGKIKTDPGQR